MNTLLQTLHSLIAIGIVVGIIGLFLYKTYQVLQNKPVRVSPWKRVQAKVLASRVTDRFLYGRVALEVDLEYTLDGKRYTGTGQTALYPNEQPPSTVELVYKPETPEAWEWAEDHDELQETPSETRFAILFIWFLLIFVSGGVLLVVYFPQVLK